MQVIFDRPVFANSLQNALGITVQTRDIKANALGFLGIDDPCTNDHGNAS